MFWLNHVTLGGVIACVPSVEMANGIEVMTLTLRTIRPLATRHGGQAHCFTVKCYQDIAKYVLDRFPMGSAVVIDGELQEQSCADSDGMTRYATVVVAHRVFSATATPEETAALSNGYAEAKREARNSRANPALAAAQTDQSRRMRQRREETRSLGTVPDMRRVETTRISIAT